MSAHKEIGCTNGVALGTVLIDCLRIIQRVTLDKEFSDFDSLAKKNNRLSTLDGKYVFATLKLQGWQLRQHKWDLQILNLNNPIYGLELSKKHNQSLLF